MLSRQSRPPMGILTGDRGKMSRSFQGLVPLILVARLLSLHSDPEKWGSILYQDPRVTAKGGAPFATTRYASFWLSLTYNLTQYFRHITPKKLLATRPHCSSPKPRVVNSRTAAKTSNTKPTPTSSIVSPLTAQASIAPTHFPQAASSPAPTSSTKTAKSRTSALGRMS